MGTVTCPYEVDLLDAIQTSRWPDRADPTLVAHVRACDICRDVSLVAPVLATDLDGAANSRLPEAGAMWLRAQLRARAEAERRATHPITIAQAAAIGLAAAVTGALFGATSGWFQGRVADFVAHFAEWQSTSLVPGLLASTLADHLSMTFGALLVIALAPVAAYFIVRE